MSLPPVFHSVASILQQRFQNFCRPRQLGSTGEKDTQIFLFQQLKRFGSPATTHAVSVPYDLSLRQRIREHLGGGIGIIALGVLVLFGLRQLELAMVGWFLVTLGFSLESLLTRLLYHLMFVRLRTPPSTTKNLVQFVPALKTQEIGIKMAAIVLIAHYDSAHFPLRGFRRLVAFFGIYLGIGVVFAAIFYHLGGISLLPPRITVFAVLGPLGAIVGVTLAMIGVLRTPPTNLSPGVRANGAGCVAFLEILDRLHASKQQLEWSDLFTVFTGGEYFNQVGLRQFLNDHASDFQQYRDVYVLHCESLAAPLAFTVVESPSHRDATMTFLIDMIEHHAQPPGISRRSFPWLRLPSSLFSAWRPARVHALRMFTRDRDRLHSTADTLSDFSLQTFMLHVNMMYNLILSLDQRIKDLIPLDSEESK